MGEVDFDHLLSILTAAYGVSYHDENSVEYMRAEMVFQQAAEDRWSGPDFRKRLKAFVKSNKWPTWTPADFFAVDRPKVWNHTWYVEQITPPNGSRGNIPMLRAYRVPGSEKPVWGWIHEVGDSLPEHVPVVVPEVRQLDSAPISDDTAQLLRLTSHNLRLEATIEEQAHEIASLKTECGNLRSELLAMESERNRERDRADAAMRELDDWTADDEATSGFPAIGDSAIVDSGIGDEGGAPPGFDAAFPVTGVGNGRDVA